MRNELRNNRARHLDQQPDDDKLERAEPALDLRQKAEDDETETQIVNLRQGVKARQRVGKAEQPDRARHEKKPAGRYQHNGNNVEREPHRSSVGLGEMLDKPADALTVAGRKRLELARALATEPKLLLLDEVLAGLNPSEIRDIVPVIRDFCRRGITILMIEHVMQAVMSLAEHVFVLAEGRIIAEGAPAKIVAEPIVVEAYLGRGAAAKLGAQHGR